MRALLIGFGPFPGAARNPSAELIARVAKRRTPALANAAIVPAILPTTYAAALEQLPALLKRHDPDIVLFFGLASRTSYVRIEQRAVNRATVFYPDVAKKKHPTRALIPEAASTLSIRADARRLLAATRNIGIDARLSRDAGRYICNASYYRALSESERTGRPRLVAFVHIPWPRRRRRLDAKPGPRRPTIDRLAQAGGAILSALAAQARRSKPAISAGS